jgi:hypothetical protein
MTDKIIFKKHFFDVISFLNADERCDVYDSFFAHHFLGYQHDLVGKSADILDMLLKMTEKREVKKKEKKEFKPPTPIECREYFKTNGYSTVAADNFHRYYSAKNWHNSMGKPVLSWKGTASAIWFTPENQMIKPQVQQVKQSITEEDKRY